MARPELINAPLSVRKFLSSDHIILSGPTVFVLNDTVPPIVRAGSRFQTSDIAFVNAE